MQAEMQIIQAETLIYCTTFLAIMNLSKDIIKNNKYF